MFKTFSSIFIIAFLFAPLFLIFNTNNVYAAITAYQFPNVISDGTLDTECENTTKITFASFTTIKLITSASASCTGTKEDKVKMTVTSSSEQNLVMAYLDNGGYSVDTVVTGQPTGNNITIKSKNVNATGYIRLVEVNASTGAVISTLDTHAVDMTINVKHTITDLSDLTGTVSSGNTFGIKISIAPDNTTSTDIETKWGVYGGPIDKEITINVDETAVPDTTAPSIVSNLAASGASQTTINLNWSAPGDDGSTGTAISYDVRYSTAEINDGNWSGAAQATGEPLPSIAGTAESFTVTGLSADTTYYFAIKTSDEIPNESGISNVPSLATSATPDTTTPSAVSDLATGSATANSIDLNWTAPGDDAGSGTATTYDIRYSTATINDGNWASATTVTGEPSPSVAGSSESMTVSGLTFETTYYFALKTSDESLNESAISNVPNLATSAEAEEPAMTIPSGGGTVSASKIHLSGQAYPNSKIEVLRKGSLDALYKNIPIDQSTINDDGTFSILHLGLLGANYLIALRIEDKDGRQTGIISFNVDLASQDLVVEDIFVPPTVGFENSIVKKGADVHIVGYAAPDNIVELEIGDIKKETTSNADGFYEFVMDTSGLGVGNHSVRARQIASSTEEVKTSNFSMSRIFKLSKLSVPLADFNNDGVINITDWSIFLFRWGSEKIDLKSKIDLDRNGTINIADFSIFLRAFSI